MIQFFQPIGMVDPAVDGWGFVAMPGVEVAGSAITSSAAGGPHQAIWPLFYVDGGEHVGHELPSFGDDFYERIHLSIVDLDLGNVISLQERAFTLWNAFFEYRELVSVVAQNATGVTIVGLPAMPAPFPALRHDDYTVLIDTDGPPTIDASFIFTFASGEVVELHLTGRRVIVFPFVPNWSSPFSETLEWRTNVLRAHSGKEQRRSLRVVPRRGFEYALMLHGRDADRLETVLWGWSIRDFVLPVWSDASRLTAQANAGNLSLQFDTSLRSFNVGDYLVLYINSTNYEAAEIESIAADSVTIVSPITNSWPVGTKVFPAVVARLPDTTPTQRHTDRVLTGRVTFQVKPESTYPYLPDSAPAVTYEGIEVYTLPLNWGSPINNDFTREMLVADAGVGAISYFAKDAHMRVVRPFEWVLKNRTEIVAFREFIARRQGQFKTCWIPSWHGDFTMVGITGPSSASLEVAGTEFASLVGVDSSRNRLRVRLNNGTVFYRTIEGVTQLVTTTLLGLNDDFGITLDPSNVRSIDLLLRCRLATDKVEIPWLTDGVATPKLTFTTADE